MSKEEILENKIGVNYAREFGGSLTIDVFDAMDEYAKQEAIGFAEWLQENGWEKYIGENNWRNRMGYATEYTTEQLYSMQPKNK